MAVEPQPGVADSVQTQDQPAIPAELSPLAQKPQGDTNAPSKPNDPATAKIMEPVTAAPKTNWGTLILVYFFVGLLGIAAFGILFATASSNAIQLDVYASLQRTRVPSAIDPGDPKKNVTATETWTVKGHVLDGGYPVAGALVWLVATDDAGNQFAAVAEKVSAGGDSSDPNYDRHGSGPNGEFTFKNVPINLSPDGEAKPIKQIRIFAREPGYFRSRGETIIQLTGSEQKTLRIQNAVLYVFLLLLLFAISILTAFASNRWPKLYYLSIVLAFLFMVSMIGTIAFAQFSVSEIAKGSDVVNLGVAFVFRGSYVKDVQPELLVSLTSPPVFNKKLPANTAPTSNEKEKSKPPIPPGKNEDGQIDKLEPAEPKTTDKKSTSAEVTNDDVVKGLGAPLWVLFIAVIGAGLFTIALIIREIKERPGPDKMIERIPHIIEHQFFLFFAPLGGIFLYQILLQSGAASHHVTVATGALASGLMVNYLMSKALELVQKMQSK